MRYLSLLGFMALGCCGIEPPCVVPPPTLAANSHDIAVGLAVKFASLPISPSLETDFKNASSEAFATLNDDNAAYYMSLQAIDCYLRRGKAGQVLAIQLATGVQQRWFSGRPKTARLPPHPQADEIHAMLVRIGVEKP